MTIIASYSIIAVEFKAKDFFIEIMFFPEGRVTGMFTVEEGGPSRSYELSHGMFIPHSTQLDISFSVKWPNSLHAASSTSFFGHTQLLEGEYQTLDLQWLLIQDPFDCADTHMKNGNFVLRCGSVTVVEPPYPPFTHPPISRRDP